MSEQKVGGSIYESARVKQLAANNKTCAEVQSNAHLPASVRTRICCLGTSRVGKTVRSEKLEVKTNTSLNYPQDKLCETSALIIAEMKKLNIKKTCRRRNCRTVQEA